MKRTLLWIIVIFSSLISLEAQETNIYSLIKVKTFNVGSSDDRLGYISSEIVVNGPTGIGFSMQGRLYILDYFNHKLKIANGKFLFGKSIVIDDDTWCPGTLLVMKNVVVGLNSYRVSYMKNDGKVKNIIWHEDAHTPIHATFLTNICLSYDDQEVKAYLLDSNEKTGCRLLDESATRDLFDDPVKYGLAGVELDNKNRLFMNGELVTRNYKTFFDYWMEKYEFSTPKNFWQDKRHNFPPTNGTSAGVGYLGKDSSGNIYWEEVGEYISIFNRQGFIIDYIRYDSNKSKTLPAVHPSGDVYFLDYDPNGVYLYRVENVWDKAGRAFWHETNAKVTSPNVRLRDKPSLNGAEKGYLQADERVAILETSAELTKVGDKTAPWYRVKTKSGLTAWAYGGFIEKDGE